MSSVRTVLRARTLYGEFERAEGGPVVTTGSPPERLRAWSSTFIGQHRAEFRFDDVYASITGIPRGKLERAVKEGFPYLPSGCVFQLDRVVRDQVLGSLKRAVATAATLARELRELAGAEAGSKLTLAAFLEASGREVEDVYRAGGWTTLLARAGVGEKVDEDTKDLSRPFSSVIAASSATRLTS